MVTLIRVAFWADPFRFGVVVCRRIDDIHFEGYAIDCECGVGGSLDFATEFLTDVRCVVL